MHVINVEFFSLETEPVAQLFGETGVYVLWSPFAHDRPTYIGEGILLKRLARHVDWLTRGVTGLAAVTSLEVIRSRRAKKDAEIVEAVLLWIANAIGRYPTKNEAPGKGRRVDAVFLKDATLRINVRGYHPLRYPESGSTKLRERAEIMVERTQAGLAVHHPWQRVRRI